MLGASISSSDDSLVTSMGKSSLEIPMANIDAMLASLGERSTEDELRSIVHFLGECAAKRETRTLERFHDRMQRLWRSAPPSSWLRGAIEGICRCLDGYFASIESAERLEKLAREIEDEPLWREILHTLQINSELNQVGIAKALEKRSVQVATSKTAITIALDGGNLAVKRIRGEGAKVSAAEFAKEARIEVGAQLG